MHKENNNQNIYIASKGFVYRKIIDNDVLVSIGDNIANYNGYIEINPSAALLWKTLKVPCKKDDLISTLEDYYGITHEVALEDVSEFLDLLLEHNMVKVQSHGIK